MPDHPAWIFDPVPASGAKKGGLASAHVFDPNLDSFVREVLQNSRDQRLPGGCARVRFVLHDISGADLHGLLDRLGWPDLERHISAAVEKRHPTLSGRLRTGLEAVAAGRLRVLVVEDADTNGLTGDEFAEGDNFPNLTRHELVTPDRANSGGSFGLGKSVLWRFSMLSTVFFNSHPVGQVGPRFIGRSQLSGHETGVDEEWEGSGWFGALDLHPKSGAPRAVSLTGTEAEKVVTGTPIERTLGTTGTSIMILGFDDPVNDLEPSVAETCRAMVKSATRWFWPALQRGDLTVSVQGWVDGAEVFPLAAAPDTDALVQPFVDAVSLDIGPADPATSRPEVREWEYGVDVPATRPDPLIKYPAAAQHAVVKLRAVIGRTSADGELTNTVALTRGTGMVIEYRPVALRAGVEQSIHGVLLTGEALGGSDQDLALERFLRACEPPAHHCWTAKTDRVVEEYAPKTQIKKAVDGVIDGIAEKLAELAPPPPDDSDEGPDAFKELFPLSSGGEEAHVEQFFLREAAAVLTDGAWVFGGTFVRRPKTLEEKEASWAFRVSLQVVGDGVVRPVPFAVFEVDSSGRQRRDAEATVDVGENVEEVSFSGRTIPLVAVGIPAGQEHRVAGRIKVDKVPPL